MTKPSDFCCLNLGCSNPAVCDNTIGFSCGDPRAADPKNWKQPPVLTPQSILPIETELRDAAAEIEVLLPSLGAEHYRITQVLEQALRAIRRAENAGKTLDTNGK